MAQITKDMTFGELLSKYYSTPQASITSERL